MPKLTLNADKDTIDKAKQLAEERGISVSTMFRQFIEMLGTPHRRDKRRLPPLTRRSRGIAKAPTGKSDRELIEEALLAKYCR